MDGEDILNTGTTPGTIHICAAEPDRLAMWALERHCDRLSVTHRGQIPAGVPFKIEHDRMIDAAKVIVLLVSADFLHEDSCTEDAGRALERHKAGEARIVPVLCRKCDWEPSYAHLLRLPRGPDGRPTPIVEAPDATLTDIARELRALIRQSTNPLPPGPFPGLAPFDETRAKDFFGREEEIAEALKELAERRPPLRWLQIEGPSGAGKSSFARAGILPAIREGKLADGPEKWVVTVMRPGSDPITSLAEALARHTEPCLDLKGRRLGGVKTELDGATDALAMLLRDCRPDGHRVLLLVDQLEEVFTLARAGDPAVKQFDALLAAALADKGGPLVLVTTIRSDFVARMAELPALEARLSEPQVVRFYLHRMKEAALRSAIEKPAARVRLSYEAGLVERILKDAGTSRGALPLVAHVLHELYLQQEALTLTTQAYQHLGGVGGALAKSANAMMDSFDKDGRARARNLLLRLVKIGRGYQDVPQTAERNAAVGAAGGGPEAEHVLARLSGGGGDGWAPGSDMALRFVVVSGQAGRQQVDLVHDALLQQWADLRAWVAEARDALELRDDVEAAARIWEASGRLESELPRGATLLRFQGAVRAALQQRAREFLDAAEKAEAAAEAAEQGNRAATEAAKKAEEDAAKLAEEKEQAAAEEKQRVSTRNLRLKIVGLIAVVLGLLLFASRVILLAGELEDSKRAQIRQANVKMARMVAGTVVSQLRAFSDAVERVASDEELSRALEAGDRDTLASLCQETYDRYDDPSYGLNVSGSSPFNMWFVLNKDGIMQAQYGRLGWLVSLGKDYPWRDYFKGAGRVAAKGGRTAYVSRAYRSEDDSVFKCSISAPIYGTDRRLIGVLVAGVASNANLGSLELDDTESTAVLAAPRDRERRDPKPESPYLILRHPAYGYGEATGFDDEQVRMISEASSTGDQHFERPFWPTGPELVAWSDDYRDPVAQTHSEFEGSWLAGYAPVANTGLVVIVQTRGTAAGIENALFWQLAKWVGIASIPLALFLLGMLGGRPKKGWLSGLRRER